jgi:signal-transduction protein with cAMP-binding, CBS, and nucleotidyltransferase domain
MTHGVDPVDPAATVQEAATRMAELDVGALFVGSGDKLVGVLTDRDIIVRLVVDGKSPVEVKVGDIMSPAVYSCSADDPVEAVFAEMRERQIRRMPVIDAAGTPVGVVTLGDLATAVESPETLKENLREISEPHRSRKEREKEDPPDEATEAPDPPTEADRTGTVKTVADA